MLAERILPIAIAILVAQIPFEVRYTLLGLTNLQWSFVAVVLAGAPIVFDNRRNLVRDRLVQAAALFVATQWAAAAFAPEFQVNAVKGAVRFTAGSLLLLVFRSLNDHTRIFTVWGVAAAASSLYALIAYAGFGVPWLFRTGEFYINQAQRLSGSFEYPNIAAAYYGMSLVVVCWSSFRPVLKWSFAFLLWIALILTFSKGALAAVALVVVLASARWRSAAPVLGAGAVAYALLLPLNPYFYQLIHGPGKPISAEYKTSWNQLQQQPAARDRVTIQIQNTGLATWPADGWRRVRISYRWLNTETDRFVLDVPVLVTDLPRDVHGGETVEVEAVFETPSAPGKHLLALELFRGDFDWFSRTGVWPLLISADIRPSVARSVGTVDLTEFYPRSEDARALTASVPRSSLWRSALRMFLDHPFGVGPDNYRLLYGNYLDATSWDTKLYSNNLYLELLTGSGVLGLASFLLMVAAMRWRSEAGCLAAAVFLLHGLVDVFLMTTPIYFAFWIAMAGCAGPLLKSPRAGQEIIATRM